MHGISDVKDTPISQAAYLVRHILALLPKFQMLKTLPSHRQRIWYATSWPYFQNFKLLSLCLDFGYHRQTDRQTGIVTLYVITQSLAIIPFKTNYYSYGTPALFSDDLILVNRVKRVEFLLCIRELPEFKSRPGDQLL
jgi:hypothetical protein